MLTVTVALGERSYPIHIGNELTARSDLIIAHLAQPRVAVVTNPVVGELYLDRLSGALEKAGVAVVPIILPDGESHKTWQTLNLVFDRLLEQRCERKTTLIALGGGVIGDITGFAAAVYLRGVPFIQVPTTLLAQVDSSVGGKTGINHPMGKNMIGAFYQPRLVLADTDTLQSLPDRELAAGLAEVIKYGLIRDVDFLSWLEANMDKLVARDAQALAYAVRRSCEVKAQIVSEDERETDVRALLNLGHTFGHAIEAGLGFGTWLHGEAVAAGMVCASRLSERVCGLEASQSKRIASLVAAARLPTTPPKIEADRWLDLMGRDKKVAGGSIRFVLLEAIGRALLQRDIAPDDVLAAIRG